MKKMRYMLSLLALLIGCSGVFAQTSEEIPVTEENVYKRVTFKLDCNLWTAPPLWMSIQGGVPCVESTNTPSSNSEWVLMPTGQKWNLAGKDYSTYHVCSTTTGLYLGAVYNTGIVNEAIEETYFGVHTTPNMAEAGTYCFAPCDEVGQYFGQAELKDGYNGETIVGHYYLLAENPEATTETEPTRKYLALNHWFSTQKTDYHLCFSQPNFDSSTFGTLAVVSEKTALSDLQDTYNSYQAYQFTTGTTPGTYKAEDVEVFKQALDDINTILTDLDADNSEQAIRKAISNTFTSYMAVLKGENPIIDGYYRFVSTQKSVDSLYVAISEKNGTLTWNHENALDPSQVWKVTYDNATGLYSIENAYNGKKIDSSFWSYSNGFVYTNTTTKSQLGIQLASNTTTANTYYIKYYNQPSPETVKYLYPKAISENTVESGVSFDWTPVEWQLQCVSEEELLAAKNQAEFEILYKDAKYLADGILVKNGDFSSYVDYMNWGRRPVSDWTYNEDHMEFGSFGYMWDVHKNGEAEINKFFEMWQWERHFTTGGELNQVVKNLPSGKYRLEADMIAANTSNQEIYGVNLFVTTADGQFTKSISTAYGLPEHFVLDFTTSGIADAVIGVEAKKTNAAWVAMDNVKLTPIESKIGDVLKTGAPALGKALEAYTVNCATDVIKYDHTYDGVSSEMTDLPASETAIINAPAKIKNSWETQAFFMLNEPVPAGTKLYVSFDYKSSVDANIPVGAHSVPHTYNGLMYNLHSTTEWQTYSNEIIVTKEKAGAAGFGCIALDLSNEGADIEFQFKNIRISKVKPNATQEDLDNLKAAVDAYYNILKENYVLADGTELDHNQQFYASKFIYTRKFNTTNWQSLYVPAPIPVSSLTEQGLRAAYINAFHQYDTDGDDVPDQLTMEIFYINKGTLYANHPYMIRAISTGNKEIVANDIFVEPAEECSIDCSSTTFKYTVTGKYQKTTAAELKENGYYFMSGGGLSKLSASSNATLGAERWILNIENRGAQFMDVPLPNSIKIRAIDEDGTVEETTFINTIEADNNSTSTYDITGRRVQNVNKGIYIVNGKKIMK